MTMNTNRLKVIIIMPLIIATYVFVFFSKNAQDENEEYQGLLGIFVSYYTSFARNPEK